MAKEASIWRTRLLVGTVFAAPVAASSMASMIPGFSWLGEGPVLVGGLPLVWLLQALLATVVQVGGSIPLSPSFF